MQFKLPPLGKITYKYNYLMIFHYIVVEKDTTDTAGYASYPDVYIEIDSQNRLRQKR